MSKKSKKDRKEKRQKVNDEFHQRVLNGKIEEKEIEEEIEVEEFEPTTFEDDLKEIREEKKKIIIKRCENKNCTNEAMKSLPICVECYSKISCDMAKTVKNGDDTPMKIM